MSNVQQHLNYLGKHVIDRVTGITGVVTSICFDLYGCIQAIVNRGLDKEGKPFESNWYDIARLRLLDGITPAMEMPDFEAGPVAEGRKGAAEKPACSKP